MLKGHLQSYRSVITQLMSSERSWALVSRTQLVNESLRSDPDAALRAQGRLAMEALHLAPAAGAQDPALQVKRIH